MNKVIEEYALRRAEEERRKNQRDVAIRMLQKGKFTTEEISELTLVPVDEVRRLQLELTATA